MTTTSAMPNLQELTDRGRQIWSSGDFNEIARQTMMIAEDVCRAADPRPTQAVLDVACGSGNAALVAARRYCEVAGIDIASNLIERAKLRAAAEGSTIDFRVGDAQNLPFRHAGFDVVISIFGVMFAPDQDKAASEMLRVCRPGGRIAMANWMPKAFGADFFGAHAKHVPPPAGVPSPLRWGTEEGVRELLGDAAREIRCEQRTGFAYYRSVQHAVELFRKFFGPTIRAFNMVGEGGAEALRSDLAAVFEKYNMAEDGTVVARMEYLQTMATRA